MEEVLYMSGEGFLDFLAMGVVFTVFQQAIQNSISRPSNRMGLGRLLRKLRQGPRKFASCSPSPGKVLDFHLQGLQIVSFQSSTSDLHLNDFHMSGSSFQERIYILNSRENWGQLSAEASILPSHISLPSRSPDKHVNNQFAF